MALVNCSECGREISDRAGACPGCGAPVPGADNTSSMSAARPSASPVMGIVAVALGLSGTIMPYFAAVFLVPAAFVCAVIAFRRGQRGLGGTGMVLAGIGLIGIITVSQQISKAQADLERSLGDLQNIR